MKRLGIIVLLLAMSAPLAIAGDADSQSPPAKIWKYAVLIRLEFPSLKKTMWGKGKATEVKLPPDAGVTEALNAMGENSWELVAVVPGRPSTEPFETVYYFKKTN